MRVRFGIGAKGEFAPARWTAFVHRVEEAGFDSLWVADERLYRDVYATLTQAALASTRLRLGTAATNPYVRPPALTAAAVATVDELSGGRTVLGLAAGGSAQCRCNFPLMTVRENLEMAGYLRRDREVAGDIERLMDRFPLLRAKARARAGDLSGGQQQLLELAMGLLGRPVLLLVDEPSMGLAPAATQTVFETLREINASGTTVLLVEQNARRALEIAHRGLVMDLGTIRYDASAAQLLRDPRVTALYLGG